MTDETHNNSINNSVAKAVTILNCFSYEKPRLRLKNIAAMTGINPATAYRMLYTLKEFGLIEQKEDAYSLGRGFLKYEGIVLNSMEIRRIALPFMEELSNTLKANVNLAILDDTEVVYIARAETPYCLYGYFHIGMRRPIHSTALGKVLTCKKTEIVHEVFKQGVPSYTLSTITDEPKFLEELERVYLQGYALDREEWSNGINCAAVPLFDDSGEVVAGISISGPVSVYPLEKLQTYIPILIEYAHRISARLGSMAGW